MNLESGGYRLNFDSENSWKCSVWENELIEERRAMILACAAYNTPRGPMKWQCGPQRWLDGRRRRV